MHDPAAQGEHAAAGRAGGHAGEGHGAEHHGGGHADQPINWAHGFVGEKDGVESGLLWRPTGTPPPALANFINSGLLLLILIRFGRKPVLEGLRARKQRIVHGMEEAAKMHAEASEQLAGYERKLANIEAEITRVRREMREAAEAERERILTEARERRQRVEREARLLVEQELKAMRETLMRETVHGAVRSALDVLRKETSMSDQQRLADELLQGLESSGINASGGRA